MVTEMAWLQRIGYHADVIRRFYVHNFRCLENFDLTLGGRASTLLIGKNGAGKTTVSLALELLQKIGRGTNRISHLLSPIDLTRGQPGAPMRFELEVELAKQVYTYAIAFELPAGFKELRVREEKLFVDGQAVYTRELARVHLSQLGQGQEAAFNIDWHLVALPIIQYKLEGDPLAVFKEALSRILVLRPYPAAIQGDSSEETLQPVADLSNFSAWFSGLLAYAPAAYGLIERYLKQLMPDFKDIRNQMISKDARSLYVQFSNEKGHLPLPFQYLSDGEKCFMICALVLAMNEILGPLCCFWDEPDNYLGTSEVGHFVTDLRRSFESGGQLIATSHHPEAILTFSNENTLVLFRRSHLEPTQLRPLSDIDVGNDLATALIRGDVEP